MKTTRSKGAFTIIEVLLVISVISIIGSATYYTVSTSQETARERKLEADVASLNSAAQVYLANGGNLPGDLTADQVIAKLKTRADATSGAQAIGLKGSTIDDRIQSVWQNMDEAGSEQLRAAWDGNTRRFVLSRSGAGGIKRFELNAALAGDAPATETRNNNLAAATETQWVWDYNETTDSTPTLGTAPTTGTGAGYAPPTASALNTLAAPNFSHQGGNVALLQFDLSVTLTNPNPAGTSQIYYTTGGALTLYKGESISVGPGGQITALAVSVDPDRWNDSDSDTKTYSTSPVNLAISLNAAQGAMTYQQAGGQMTNAEVQTPAPATVNLLSAAQIPAQYLNSDQFQIYYTTDGSDPTTSETALAGTAFSETFSSPQIDVSISRWGTGSSLTIKAVARSLNPEFFVTSPVVSQSISITPTSLVAPIIDPASGVRSDDLPISITLAQGASYPADARIYYTTDGSDPGPGAGTLYTAPFTLGPSATVVKARVYGPAAIAEQWFTPSGVTEATYQTVNVPEGALVGNATVNGTFYGSIIYTNQMNNLPQYINFNSSASVLQGNVYFPGTPTFNFNGNMNTIIQGRQFNADGTEILPNTDTARIVDLDGSVQPNNYFVTFNSGAVIQGKVYRRATPPTMPAVSNPPNPSNGNYYTLNGGSATISANEYGNANVNSGTLTLNPGNYGNFNVGGTLVLGVPGATVPAVYNFQGMNLNSGSKVVIVGPVVLTMRYGLNANSEIGNAANPDWLQLQMAGGDFTMNSSAKVYAKVVAPNNTVNLNGTFNGSVAAKTLVINGNGIAFTLPPVVSGS